MKLYSHKSVLPAVRRIGPVQRSSVWWMCGFCCLLVGCADKPQGEPNTTGGPPV